MTLQWTTLDIPVGGGLDTRTNEKLLQAPFAADLQNVIFPANGLHGYETRAGYDRVAVASTLTEINCLSTRDSDLFCVADDRLYTLSELDNNVDWNSLGNLLNVAVDLTTLDTQATNQTRAEILNYGGLEVFAWYDSGTSAMKYTILDAESKAVISANNAIANAEYCKILGLDNSILIIYYNSSTTAIRCTNIPIYDPTSAADSELKSDAHADGVFDAKVLIDGSNKVGVVYKNTTPVLNYFTVDSSATASSNTTVYTALGVGADPDVLSFAPTIDDIGYVAGYDGTYGELFIKSIGYGADQTQAISNVVNVTVVADPYSQVEDQTQVYIFYEVSAASASNHIVYVLEADNSGVDGFDLTTPLATLRHCSLASQAFWHGPAAVFGEETGGLGYVHVAHESTLQSCYFLVNSNLEHQAKVVPERGQGNVVKYLPKVTDGLWAPVYREKLDFDIDDGTDGTIYAQYGIKRCEYDFDYRVNSVQYGAASYIAAGFLWAYDGNQIYEQGFHLYPEGTTAATASAGGSMTSGATYAYRIYYEWYNARGERQRSTYDKVLEVTLGASDTEVTLTIPTLSHTAKGNDVSIVVYRSEANPDVVGGASFNRVSSPDPSATGANGYIANDTTADSVTFNDELADTSAVKNELDYQNGNFEVDNISLPAAKIIGESKRRVWIAGFENKSRAYFSKQRIRDNDQLEFHDGRNFFVEVPEEGGAITAFGALNHFTVIFKADSCYAVSGEGPNNGNQNQFNIPQIVSLDVGCISQKSVVNIPQGILFKSNKGIWRLGHNLDMQYVGAPVEAYNTQDVVRATLVPDRNHVIFLTSSGRTLVYNYLVNAWSTFTNHVGTDAVLLDNVYHYARTNGRLYRQGSNYSDDGTAYSPLIRTAPIAIRGAQGVQKVKAVKLLGTYYSPHDLRVRCIFNHEPGPVDTGTWNPVDNMSIDEYGSGAYGSGAYGGSGNPVYEAEFRLPRQKCSVVQFIIDTTNTTNAGRFMSVEALQAEVGSKGGLHNTAKARKFSATGGSTD